jgi:phosphoserine aminotransferase
MDDMTKTAPAVRPVRPYFSSGPCAKRPGWTVQALKDAELGRSHRAKAGKAKLKRAIDLTREVLKVPADYRIGIVPASDTGAVEMALWSLLGPRGVDLLTWESFGEGWVTDTTKQLKLKDARVIKAGYGDLPDLTQVDTKTRDVVFTWNGTTSGVRVPDGNWIAANREGLTICDATSAAFAQRLDFAKLDVVTFSWQKALGGEAAHGMLILSPRAVARLTSYVPPWPLPKIFRLTSGGKLIEGIFEGETINTPSLLATEDYLDALLWGRSVGGLDGLVARADANAKVIFDWVERTPWIANLAKVPATQHQRLPRHRRPRRGGPRRRGGGKRRQEHRRQPREGRHRLRHRGLSRRTAGPAHLVRRHCGRRRRGGADAMARLRLCAREGEARQGGVVAPCRLDASCPRSAWASTPSLQRVQAWMAGTFLFCGFAAARRCPAMMAVRFPFER